MNQQQQVQTVSFEVRPDLINAAVQFMRRAELKGAEVDAYATVMMHFNQIMEKAQSEGAAPTQNLVDPEPPEGE